MDQNVIKHLADLTRFGTAHIKELWENPYIVIRHLSEIATEERKKSSLVIKTFSISKRASPHEVRNIYYPNSQKLNTILKVISKWLSLKYTPPVAVHGFVKTRGIKTNAEQHLQCKVLLKVDLENYFEQIDQRRIIEALVTLGIQKELATLVSKICTVEGKLVQGFSTSPVISNIVTEGLDVVLISYCSANKVKYTRYADDMSFSSSGNFIDLDEINKIISDFGFVINETKTKFLKRGFYQSVTGLTIFDELQPRIPKRVKRRLRLETYFINKYGIKNHAIRRLVKVGIYNKNSNIEADLATEINRTRERIEGWINFSKGIEPEFSSKIQKIFEERNHYDSP